MTIKQKSKIPDWTYYFLKLCTSLVKGIENSFSKKCSEEKNTAKTN